MAIAIDDFFTLIEGTKLAKEIKDNILRKDPVDSVIDQVFKEIKSDEKYFNWVAMLDEIQESKNDLFIKINIIEKDEFVRKLSEFLEVEELDWFYDDFKKRYNEKLVEYASQDIGVFKPYMVNTTNGIEADIRHVHETLQEILKEYKNSKDYNEANRKLLEVYVDQFDRIYGIVCNLQKDTSVDYAKNIFNRFSTFENLAYYIDLKCYDDTQLDIVLIDKYVEKWLGENKYPILAILGDSGTGKTTYVTNLVKQFADRYIEDNSDYLPILVQLKNFTNFWNLEDLIKNYNITYGLGSDDFENKYRQRKILFVFDGYDELPKGTIEKFNEINSLISDRNKVIITSRTHFFKYREDEKLFLNPESIDFTGISLKDESNVRRVYINLFTKNDIKKYLERYFGANSSARYETISRTYNLSDLSRRPILLNLIVQTLSDFSQTTDVTQSKLYDTYINKWMSREKRKGVDPKYVSVVMEELAFKMFTENISIITIDELYEIINRKFKADIRERKVDIDDINKKIRTASFIYRDLEDNFMFMHKSFMEFFIAKKLSQEINKGIIDHNSFGKVIITPEIINFMKDMVSNKSLLLSIIEHTIGKSEHEVGFLGGNAITILKNLSQDFCKIDFSSMVLSGADLSNCILSDTCFRKTVMESVKLSDSILKFADFSEADLNGANLIGSSLEGANFDDTDCTGARLRFANLRKTVHKKGHFVMADLEEANLEEAILEGAILEGTNLKKAHLERANLTGAFLNNWTKLEEAHLEEANFTGAYLDGVDFTKAHLKGTNLTGAYLTEANLKGAKDLTIYQLSKVKTLYNAKLNLELEKLLREKYPNLFDEP
jgi:uncharacterized protein YjbI with pentapeptide repeats